ncbi:lipoamide acyltransferase component of branched-chain alpha-keto acid dehydrogenase complex, mitochondrial [Typha angustifolia]|uniref:lipoamide acyltransferase component of branched-chain alpha-keto acid dehydrogenase complex, mitochondrial n=1 Tax=Typha angustifolia TaxID=59011 RepID=UPI003C2F13FF
MAWRRLCGYARIHRRSPPFSAIASRTPSSRLGRPLFGLSALLFLSPLSTTRSLASLPLYPDVVGFRNLGKRRWLSSQGWVDVPSGEVVEVPLAQTGEGIAECELLKWFVEEGDQVEEFERLCEVQSDKATIEITSRFKGKVLQILPIPGDIVKVGETLLKMLVEDAQTPFTSESPGSETMPISDFHDMDCQSSSGEEETLGRVLSTPAVRNLAKQYGLNINDIPGTGKDGRVLKEDVLSYASSKDVCKESASISHANAYDFELLKEGKTSSANNVDSESYEDKKIPLRGFQRSMVKSMSLAAKVPHFHYLEEINCDALVELKASFQNNNTDQNVKHTFLPFLIKSLSMALNKYPLLNSSFNEETNEVILKGCHNIGVAMATPYGLVVPNIKKVQSLSILEITQELSRLQQMASNNKLSNEDITGGTITLSNIGAIGGKFGSPLLNLPEVAIIALGRIQKLPRFDDDENVYPASVTNVTIGADHRIVDGATVARFCNEWKFLIEKPELLLLHMR